MEADAKEPTGVTRGQNAVQVMPLDWSAAEQVLATLVDRIDSARVRSASNFIVVRIMRTGESTLFASGRYLDRILLKGDNGQPQFEERVVVLDSRAVDTLLAIPL